MITSRVHQRRKRMTHVAVPAAMTRANATALRLRGECRANNRWPLAMTAGSLTLVRGLATLRLVATSKNGLSIQEVAYHVGVHRTVASRMLNTLTEFGLVSRGKDGRYRSPTNLTVFDPVDGGAS
ncbi:helix-turn-helix domain-containing protein [Mycobacterium sp. NPDC051198]